MVDDDVKTLQASFASHREEEEEEEDRVEKYKAKTTMEMKKIWFQGRG